jgi:hypothetical protein
MSYETYAVFQISEVQDKQNGGKILKFKWGYRHFI